MCAYMCVFYSIDTKTSSSIFINTSSSTATDWSSTKIRHYSNTFGAYQRGIYLGPINCTASYTQLMGPRYMTRWHWHSDIIEKIIEKNVYVCILFYFTAR